MQPSPSVLTSDVYNRAEAIFNTLQNKEKLISFLDCTTLLRGMGMNPTLEDMDWLKERMAEPVTLLEQWRREEELRQEKERKKEEKNQKGRASTVKAAAAPRKSMAEKAAADAAAENKENVKIVPSEEIKNIDWNIFISCTEEMYRDQNVEEKTVYNALKVFREEGKPLVMKRERLIQIITTNGDNILTPAEAKLLEALLPEECSYAELAARIQGTYVPPTAEELAQQAAEEEAERRRKEELEKENEKSDDPLAGL
ncbi:hypothetical protein AGDE_04453 [Angomonas deanei]|uniref:Uncharacterized protein n=1 Tax=Angomonas deanei TaxID=59799 RepID=A0A7G2CT05_9TRYP|nr:hypothetical protein AGDE_04453 [Angomonas deanei]CAD2222367.1 hypothetical protein, conserved [Angomonas deanei]|eukprot:EPY39475.1 hypothetical protein AGDE_04453 [Angomonas deanei]